MKFKELNKKLFKQQAGFSSTQLAEIYSVNTETINQWRKKIGIPSETPRATVKWTTLDQDEFKQLWQTQSLRELGHTYQVNPKTIKDWAAKIGLGPKTQTLSGAFFTTPQQQIAFPENAGDDYKDAATIEENRVIVIGDVEIPDHDIEGLEMVLKVAKKFDIRTLIINGDFVALDSFSKWARSQINKVFFSEERGAAARTLQVFLQWFENIYYHQGNHELRLPHTVDGEITIGDFLESLAGVHFSPYAHANLFSGKREFLVTHQKNFSIVPLSVPNKLAIARNKSVWCAHNHRLGWGYDTSGRHVLVEGGHLRDEKKTHYKQLRVTTHPAWNSGFGMCIDGMPYLVDRNNVDFWLSIHPPQIESELKKKSKRAK